MAITAHDDQVGARVGRVGQEHVGDVNVIDEKSLRVGLNPMPGQMPGQHSAREMGVLVLFFPDRDDLHMVGERQDRQGVGDSSRRRRTAVLPIRTLPMAGRVRIYGTRTRGRPEPKRHASTMSEVSTPFGSGCGRTTASKQRANWLKE